MDHLRHAKIEIVEVRTVRTYDRNARLHSDDQISNIATVIERFGFTNPVLIDEGNQLIAGHGRLAAAQKLGLVEIPAIRISGLSEDVQRLLVLADNRLSETSSWNEKLLAEELRALQFAFDAGDLDINLDSMGFTDGYVKDLMVLLDDPAAAEPPRDITVEDEPAVARPGETWQLGMHRFAIGGKDAARDADAVIRMWERETKAEATLVAGTVTASGVEGAGSPTAPDASSLKASGPDVSIARPAPSSRRPSASGSSRRTRASSACRPEASSRP